MSDVKYLVGTENVSVIPLKPYSDEACAFVASLSEALLKDKEAKRYSDVMSFAFWCRKANINIKKCKWDERLEKRLGRGLAFHVAPSNVPINFAFSYVFSLLAGNANIVRVPSKEFPQVALVCRVVKEVLEQFPDIKESTAFVQYPANNETTEQFSLRADARIIWGGDSTVQNIRSCASKPKCIDLVFADRYSVCIMDGRAIEEIEPEKLKKLAEAFYNDTYLMDQNACSSPQIIFWKNSSEKAKELFWNAVYEYTKPKYNLQAASCVDKYMKLCMDAVDLAEMKNGNRIENLVYRIELEQLPADITMLRGTCGYFYEYNLNSYEDILPLLSEKFQTVTYYGINPEELQEFIIEYHAKGIDRIVPLGKALEIDVVWDGYDVIGMLSRIIVAV